MKRLMWQGLDTSAERGCLERRRGAGVRVVTMQARTKLLRRARGGEQWTCKWTWTLDPEPKSDQPCSAVQCRGGRAEGQGGRGGRMQGTEWTGLDWTAQVDSSQWTNNIHLHCKSQDRTRLRRDGQSGDTYWHLSQVYYDITICDHDDSHDDNDSTVMTACRVGSLDCVSHHQVQTIGFWTSAHRSSSGRVAYSGTCEYSITRVRPSACSESDCRLPTLGRRPRDEMR